MSGEYTGHVPCKKCGQTHWMHGKCPDSSSLAAPAGSGRECPRCYGDGSVTYWDNENIPSEHLVEGGAGE